jgi:hypothetical protein
MDNKKRSIQVGNILGAPRAEADTEMLLKAFIETVDFRALTETSDFNYVVGRRGTGKSALFSRVSDHFKNQQQLLILTTKPQEFETLTFQKLLSENAPSYNDMRAIARVTWKVHLLMWTGEQVLPHYKLAKTSEYDFLFGFAIQHKSVFDVKNTARCTEIIRQAVHDGATGREIPGRIANIFQLNALQSCVQSALAMTSRSARILYDGLDEGWIPDATATSVLGGLSHGIADLRDSQIGVHGTLFIRDNMFRALAHFDGDFSRHIEGHTLRLHWDKDSLFQLIATRLRIALDLAAVENPVRIWNRFVSGNLQDRPGFESCLHYTLYRPRDILVLLNRAYVHSSRRGGDRIIDDDIESASTTISKDRLDDLLKEYDTVLPGLKVFVRLFSGRAAFDRLDNVVALLDAAIQNGPYDEAESSDFALLGSGRQILYALYGVGFLGFEDKVRGGYVFCHDGSRSEINSFASEISTVVHPCYWKALDLESQESSNQVLIQVNDEYDNKALPEVADLRVKQLGQIMAELPHLTIGKENSTEFEDWAFRVVRILFAGKLSNFELKPNAGAIQQRDIVATNMAEGGFWKRVRQDYGTRQVIFEIKNYESLKLDDYRQVLSYTSGDYGRFAIIVNRSPNEGMGETERGWIQEFWHNHQRLIFNLPASIVVRCVSKLRNPKRFDYTEDALNKRLDTFVRSYLSIKTRKA